MLSELASYHVDWADLDKAHQNNAAFLAALSADTDALRQLVDGCAPTRTCGTCASTTGSSTSSCCTTPRTATSVSGCTSGRTWRSPRRTTTAGRSPPGC
ncbi:hypothetical protein NKH77_53475 [Streptomyces sp. M19]